MNLYVNLAKNAIEKYIYNKEVISVPDDLPPGFYKKKCGVFVSIHKGRELRGCIGTYLPLHNNLAEEIIANAVAACSRDSRFASIAVDELPELSIKISLLSEPKKISDLKELDPDKYGVVIKCPDGKTGLLLPGLEGVSSAEEQLSIACQKAGANPLLEKDLEIFRFTTEEYQ